MDNYTAYELSMSELYKSNDKPAHDIPTAFEYWGMYRAEMRKGELVNTIFSTIYC